MENFNIIIDTSVIKIKIFLIKNFITKDRLNIQFQSWRTKLRKKKERNIESMFENLQK